ncbi:hypothetical protein ALC60_08207 [Trachymyrmex zeteki]|uniref:Uncharacterized protein n=1 Tax=Mycetomoellerius zeteki TaxID=64791 RepID=A0A151WYA7_9HYME|nr:hypothetical protein ALC60_08207 [Trachymyrmex zeteki]
MDFVPHEDEVMDEEINDQHEEMSDQEMSNEDHALSSDSCFDSDMDFDDDSTQVIYRDLNRAQVNAIHTMRKMCCIEFYYTEGQGRYCSSCIVVIRDQFANLRAIRNHDTAIYVMLGEHSCSECRVPLYQIIPCNMCPICTQ